ncbi:hypothetical protein JYT74_00005 [Crocinitomix catalasitica]|nr:hypothetical protein [Crocinitomix catalasitica]
MTKLISFQDGGMFLAESSTKTKSCGEVVHILENVTFRAFGNSISNGNMDILAADCGEGWTCGERKVEEFQPGVLRITCTPPPNIKCVKEVTETETKISGGDNGLLNFLTASSVSDFKKGQMLLNSGDLSQALISEFIDLSCELDPSVVEIVLLANRGLSETNLTKLMLQPKSSISDATLTNILIMNTPLSANTQKNVSRLRKDVDLSFINKFNGKVLAIAFTFQQILVGDKLIIEEISKKESSFEFTNLIELSFANPASEEDLGIMTEGCGEGYICRDLVLSKTSPTGTSVFFCSTTPANAKCLELPPVE